MFPVLPLYNLVAIAKVTFSGIPDLYLKFEDRNARPSSLIGRFVGKVNGLTQPTGMTKKLLGKAVKDKDENGQRSPWHLRQPLTDRQFQYAANDAIIPLKMDDVLCEMMEQAGLDINTSVPLETSDLTPPPPPSLPDEKTQRKIDALELDQNILYDKLRARRDMTVMYRKIAAANAFHVADTTSLINLAKRQPTTAAEMCMMSGVTKGARYEYLYDLINVIQKHLNVQVEREPEDWKYDAKVRRLTDAARKAGRF